MSEYKVMSEYKGFHASIRIYYTAVGDIFYGEIDDIEDVVSFEGDSYIEVLENFKLAVDDYLRTKYEQ